MEDGGNLLVELSDLDGGGSSQVIVAGIARESVPMFIVMQIIGLVVATLILLAFIDRQPAS